MSKILATLCLFAFGVSIASADVIDGKVQSVDGTKITIVKAVPKGSPKGTKGEVVVLTTADNVKVNKGTFDKKAKTYTTGESLTSGLQDPSFTQKNTQVHITTNADNKVTEILVLPQRKKKTS